MEIYSGTAAIGRFLNKQSTELLYAPASPHLVTYPKELKRGTQTDTCTCVFIAALFK